MREKLFGKASRDGQNCGGVHFVERKRHGAERKPPRLFSGVGGEKTALGEANCKGVFGGETAGGGKMRAKLFWGKAAPGLRKFRWCGFCGEETARGRKEASKVVRLKAALTLKNGRVVGGEKTALKQANCRGVFGEKTARGGKMRAKLYGGKPPLDGQNSGGVDFVERRRHGAERKPPRLFRWCGFCGEERARGRKKASKVVQVKAALGEKKVSWWGETALGQANWKAAPGQIKFWWCGFCGRETARGRKKASKIVQVKTALG
ncbi:hypothetical protein T11_4951 [Trichinella zimbabwensis]|uniref:Uncharacterized protein n=1 Tax=Trichinella zimbabwensis TaxID=268475 RepID=A0A0V1GMD7_9BILA|nr:hypothetical protein T11_4951 [Trichinella zimbabwensis]